MMATAMEKIHPEENDDSDAPVEMTTKTAKIEKKKKKKKSNKRRLKYTLATEDDHGLDQKRLDEESALTHLVFGDDEDYVEEITTVAKTIKEVSVHGSIEWTVIVSVVLGN